MLKINRRSDYGCSTPTLNEHPTLVDAAIGKPPKKWKNSQPGDLIEIKLDQNPVARAKILSITETKITDAKTLQTTLANMLKPETGDFHSFIWIGKLGKMFQTAQKKQTPLFITVVPTIVTEIL